MKGFSKLITTMAWMFHYIDRGFYRLVWVDAQVIFKIPCSYDDLSHQRITLPSRWIKEVMTAGRHAAEMTDNALQQLLNKVDEKKNVCASS